MILENEKNGHSYLEKKMLPTTFFVKRKTINILSNFRFSLEIETYYTPDGGHQENVFNLSDSEMRNRIVDLIDVVKDQVREVLILIKYLQGCPFSSEFSESIFNIWDNGGRHKNIISSK